MGEKGVDSQASSGDDSIPKVKKSAESKMKRHAKKDKDENADKKENEEKSGDDEDSKKQDEDENPKKNSMNKQDKLKDIVPEPEESTDVQMIFTQRNSIEDEFSVWSADKYYHNEYREVNILIRFFCEIVIFSLVLLGPPLVGLIVTDKKIELLSFFAAPGSDEDPWKKMLRRNLYCNIVYVMDVIFYIITECLLLISARILVIFGLYQSTICWTVVQSLFLKRFYGRTCLTFLFAFYLSTVMYNPYGLPKISLGSHSNIGKTLLLWLGIYMGILFVVKTIVSVSTFELKRSAYTETIFGLNYKTFVFNKLRKIAEATEEGEDVDDICENYVQGYDDGLYLKNRTSFFPSVEEARVIANNIYALMKIKVLEAEDIRRYFPEDYADVYKYLAAIDIKEGDNKAIKAKRFVSLAEELYYSRKDMERTLRGRDSVFDKLELIFSIIASYGALIVLLLLFQANAQVFMASFGTSLLTFSWIFADSIKNIYNCFIFLLIIRPYNIGDKVIVNGEILFVYKVDLLTTTFLTTFKKIVYISNTTLFTSNIYNIARSPSQSESLELEVDEATTYDQAIELEKKAAEKIKKEKSLFVDCLFRKIIKGKLFYEILHTNNFQNSDQLKLKRNKVIKIFRKSLGEAGISYKESFEFSG